MVKARGYELLPATRLPVGVDLRGFGLIKGFRVNNGDFGLTQKSAPPTTCFAHALNIERCTFGCYNLTVHRLEANKTIYRRKSYEIIPDCPN
jgi:hypothetical protein